MASGLEGASIPHPHKAGKASARQVQHTRSAVSTLQAVRLAEDRLGARRKVSEDPKILESFTRKTLDEAMSFAQCAKPHRSMLAVLASSNLCLWRKAAKDPPCAETDALSF